MTRPHIEALTALRFFAALVVVFFHHGQAQFSGAPVWCQNIVRGGYVGVPFFFILSGFILTYSYAPQAPRLPARNFWVARLARIYPVYAFALLVSAPLFLGGLAETGSYESLTSRFLVQLTTNFGLLQAWSPSLAFAWNGPGWSLSVEAFFYLTFPILLNRLTGRTRCLLLLGLVGLAGLGRLCFGGQSLGAVQRILGWANPLLWFPLFLLGMVVGERFLARPRTEAAPSPLVADVGSVFLMAVIGIILALNLQRFSQLFFCYLVAVPCTLLIYQIATVRGLVGACLGWRPLVLMGEASYSLYILHRPVHDWFKWMHREWGLLSTDTLAGFWLYLILCLALSVLTLKAIEYPCRDWIKRRFGSRAGQPAVIPLANRGVGYPATT
ncbi:MAG TPA: acyltransferase [Verrucomicrobiae bacterium]|nr:acyltransferase [Verrucomicrobiae bacterium]